MSRFDNTPFKNPHFKDLAAFKDEYQRSISDPKYFLNKAKQELSWFREPTRSNEGTFTTPKWFGDGQINISYNVLIGMLKKHQTKLQLSGRGINKTNLSIFHTKSYKKRFQNLLTV